MFDTVYFSLGNPTRLLMRLNCCIGGKEKYLQIAYINEK